MTNRLNNDFEFRDAGYSNYEDTVNLPRHRWYYYKEGFSPFLVEKAIEKVCTSENDIVIDPFNGSGTTTLAASAKGHRSIGIEVNPFTSFLSDAKQRNTSSNAITFWSDKILSSTNRKETSNLIGFSTFSRTKEAEKWLFNNSVLNAFEAGWNATDKIDSYHVKRLLRLSLIIAAMDNCNATKDGKCLRYRLTWKDNKYNKGSFQKSFEEIINIIKSDVEEQPLSVKADIINGDARKILKGRELEKFKLCVTSPPYLNTFDYTDIYRPELFLGKFVQTNQQLYNIRLSTVRSHIQAQWESPSLNDFGMLYQQTMTYLQENTDKLMDKNILKMIQAYFEDMLSILRLLKSKAAKDAELWLVVSNSAYANRELPVDLILGEIGTQAGWFLKEIGVLRHIQRRKTKHSPDISDLRESLIIFQANK